MTPEQIEAERAKFEAYWRYEYGYVPSVSVDGCYLHSDAVAAWEGWLARAQEAER